MSGLCLKQQTVYLCRMVFSLSVICRMPCSVVSSAYSTTLLEADVSMFEYL